MRQDCRLRVRGSCWLMGRERRRWRGAPNGYIRKCGLINEIINSSLSQLFRHSFIQSFHSRLFSPFWIIYYDHSGGNWINFHFLVEICFSWAHADGNSKWWVRETIWIIFSHHFWWDVETILTRCSFIKAHVIIKYSSIFNIRRISALFYECVQNINI